MISIGEFLTDDVNVASGDPFATGGAYSVGTAPAASPVSGTGNAIVPAPTPGTTANLNTAPAVSSSAVTDAGRLVTGIVFALVLLLALYAARRWA